jgi:GT2 family glycosyltransferase
MKISLVIPNYNSRKFLEKYLEKNASFPFYNVYLLDDASTDQGAEFAESLPNVKVIKGSTNLGPAGNRNRVLDQELGEIILFLDSDMELMEDPTEKLQTAFNNPRIGVAGGLILTEKNEPMWWNAGYKMGIVRDLILALIVELTKFFHKPYPEWLKKISYPFTYNLETPSIRKVGWVGEGLLAVRTDLFKNVQGFDPNFTFHEGPDLYKRIEELGYETYFYPTFSAIHHDANTRKGKMKNKAMIESTIRWYRKHGIRL